MSTSILPVILCGGSGTRLWPLSRESFPKQFVPLIGGRSLLECTLERARVLSPRVLCVTNDEHRFLVQQAWDAAGVTQGEQLLEPVGRNTAAAMACAALHARQADPATPLLFLPSDHYVPDAHAFADTIRAGLPAALEGWFVTFGVTPTFPATGYGYIRSGAPALGPAACVERFVEKPDAATAQSLLDGRHLWNAGIFLVRADTLLEALREHAPDILQACERAMAGGQRDGAFLRPERAAFEAIRSDSIDYAVLEHHARTAVVPFRGAWSDVGSWNAVAALAPASDTRGNRTVGRAWAIDSDNTYVHAEHRPVVVLGMRDTVVVETPDAVLVSRATSAEDVKAVVARLKAEGEKVATEHRRVGRPWGAYDSIDSGDRFQVKHISVRPGGQLSLQMHHHRAEHWIVVRGTAKVTRADETLLVSENESIYIPLGTQHRLENPGKLPLELIEVQSGSYLGEDDIVRFEDTYGRAAK